MNKDTMKEVIIEAVNKTIKKECEYIIKLHEKMKGCYFFNSPQTARERRYYEKQHSNVAEFNFNGDKIKIVQNTLCTCRNVYYNLKIYINDEQVKKDIRFIKKILKEVN